MKSVGGAVTQLCRSLFSDCMMDNFDRHVWQLFGAVMGVAMTALFGWPVGLGWLIGWGGGGLIFYGLVTGRIVLHRKRARA